MNKIKVNTKNTALVAIMAGGLLTVTSAARANSIEFTASGTPDSDGAGSAVAIFTIANGSLTLTLESLQQNPTGAGQLVSGINFDLSGASGSGSLTSVNSGNITTISSGGSYTAGTASSLSSWQATESGAVVNLTTLTGSKPLDLIIGPDSKGNFNPTLGGLYNNANSSIIGHDPNVLGTADFTITVPGVTSASQISDVVFQFGTGPDGTLNGVPVTNNVPDNGSTLSLFGVGFLGLAGLGRRFKAKHA